MTEKICLKCNKNLDKKEFFLTKNKKRYPICKQCLLKNIDITNTQDIKTILKIFDVPFIQSEWIKAYEQTIKLNSYKNQDKTKIFGRYLRLMYLIGFRNYQFNDTDELNAAWAKSGEE